MSSLGHMREAIVKESSLCTKTKHAASYISFSPVSGSVPPFYFLFLLSECAALKCGFFYLFFLDLSSLQRINK